MTRRLLLALALTPCWVLAQDTFTIYAADSVPQNVEALWKDYNPRTEPLEVDVVREWNEDGAVCRYVIFTVGTFKGEKSRLAAFHTFPEGAEKAPAFVWAHGGGQRAERERGAYFARHGYASIDINWGGREIVEGIEKNTDWGKVDPSQGPRFYPGALRPNVKLNLDPDEHTIDPVPSPRNGNWFLLALAGRRALTFLEQQPEVDPDKLGFTGYSMGGVITSLSAIDPRLKAVVPMVGGTGHLTEDFPGIPDSSNLRQYRHPELFTATVDSKSYWPLVNCPVLFLSATNDFHGIFDRVYQCVDLLPHDDWRVSLNLHFNHGLGAQQWILINRWFDRYLKGDESAAIPATPESRLTVDEKSGKAEFTVTPSGKPSSVAIRYSHDPNPRARFWKSAVATKQGGMWTAELPVWEKLPLFVFANLTYPLSEPVEAFQGGTTKTYTITSHAESWIPDEIDVGRLRDHPQPEAVFEDFAKNGIRDWGLVPGGALKTYRFQDPAMATPDASKLLQWTVEAPRKNLSFRLRVEKNQWLTGATEKAANYAVAQRSESPGAQVFRLSPSDFKNSNGEGMKDWDQISGLTLLVYDGDEKQTLDLSSEENQAMLGRLEWVSGEN
ncbi:MAG: dienelactone hydrolase family protein [Verrucomicrobiae bacterium]|nr:dienelactone hydrolase family protein [Verrucomicrobiae bacterium]